MYPNNFWPKPSMGIFCNLINLFLIKHSEKNNKQVWVDVRLQKNRKDHLDVVPSYHPMQFKRKNDEKHNFRSRFGLFGPNLPPPSKTNVLWSLLLLAVRSCSKLSFYTIQRKTNEQNLRQTQKNLIPELFLASLIQIWTRKCFCTFYIF